MNFGFCSAYLLFRYGKHISDSDNSSPVSFFAFLFSHPISRDENPKTDANVLEFPAEFLLYFRRRENCKKSIKTCLSKSK